MPDPHIVKAGQVYETCQPTHVVDGKPVHTRVRDETLDRACAALKATLPASGEGR